VGQTETRIWATAALIVGALLAGAFVMESRDKDNKSLYPVHAQRTPVEPGLAISSDGYAWDQAPYQEKMRLCQNLVEPMNQFPGRRDAKWYYDLLYTSYSGNPNKSTTIQDIVTLGVATHASR